VRRSCHTLVSTLVSLAVILLKFCGLKFSCQFTYSKGQIKMPRPTLPRYLAKVPCYGGTHKVPPPPYLGGEGPRYGGRGGTFSPAEGPRWGGKVDLQGPTLPRYLAKVPCQGGTWPFDLAFTITPELTWLKAFKKAGVREWALGPAPPCST
jgi:hypothetical protein